MLLPAFRIKTLSMGNEARPLDPQDVSEGEQTALKRLEYGPLDVPPADDI
ncbi:hypothetical protein GCM10010988_25390 [Cnuibacter physcomitrellae]|nr:hypothetical protein GCM10010988_25390 [Cnuibacter physcomitrellae]